MAAWCVLLCGNAELSLERAMCNFWNIIGLFLNQKSQELSFESKANEKNCKQHTTRVENGIKMNSLIQDAFETADMGNNSMTFASY